MKRWLSNFLLLLALLGQLGHSFHNHYGHEKGDAPLTANSCPICIVDDHSLATFDLSTVTITIQRYPEDSTYPVIAHHQSPLNHYNSRAPPAYS